MLEAHGLLDLFRSKKTADGYSFNKNTFKRYRDRHTIIKLLYLHSKYSGILRDPLFQGKFVSADGRAHSVINPVGADSGRPSFKKPNLVGIGKILRSIVVPDAPGFGIMELDFASQEVFIAAAHFGDNALLTDCNNGDPYCAMMRNVWPGEIDPADLTTLTDEELASKYRSLRDRAKVTWLATIYGISDEALAAQVKTTILHARRLRESLFARYPELKAGMDLAVTQLAHRGYSETVTGLKRFRREINRELTGWERRWAVNAPVQGGAACVLKLALPKVEKFLREHEARILAAPYDALVIQYRIGAEKIVADGVSEIMKEAMQTLYPGTQPRVDVNDKSPTCWNKNGRADSIERFLEDPEFKP